MSAQYDTANGAAYSGNSEAPLRNSTKKPLPPVPKANIVNLRVKHQASGTNRSAPEMTRANTVASLPSLSLKAELAPQPDPALPPLIYQCIVWLLRYGLQEEGLFRISANSTDMKALKTQFDAQRPVTLESSADPHTIAGLLKVYFRELNKPFFGPISAELYKTAEVGTPDLRYEALKSAVTKLSADNQNILSNLIMLLREVSKFSDKNCMTPRNMGICWAPTLFGGGAAGTEIVADMIDGYWHIFHNAPLAPLSPQPKKKPLPTLPPSSASVPHIKTPSASPQLSHSPRTETANTALMSPGRVKRPLSDIVVPPLIPPSQSLPPLPVGGKVSPKLSPRPQPDLASSPRAVPNSATMASSPRPLSGQSAAPPPPPQANKPKRHVKAVTDVTY